MSNQCYLLQDNLYAEILHRYWFGIPDVNGRNLATCVWRDRAHAIEGGVGPAHRKAANAARHNYTEWQIERLNLIIDDGAISWRIEEFVED